MKKTSVVLSLIFLGIGFGGVWISNPYIAAAYAKCVIAFVRDWVKQHPESKKHPFYILELGTGSGRFSFYVLKTLHEILKELALDDVSICYVMSDFTKNNLNYYETHPALQPYLEKGMLDFAVFNPLVDTTFDLMVSGEHLHCEQVKNPLIAIANYFFDSIPVDVFRVEHKTLN